MPTLTAQRIALSTGVTLDYAEQGPSTGTPLVFVHGVTDSWRSFQGLLAHLPVDARAIAVSLRGHGDSSRPAQGYRYRDMARDLRALFAALGLPAAIVAGHSMGAMVAQQFAADYASCLKALVLMGGWTTLQGNRGVQAFYDESISALTDPLDPAFVEDFQISTLARPVAPGVLAGAVTESLKVPALVWRAAFQGFLTTEPVDHRRVQVPALIAWGDQDAYSSRADQDALLKAIEGARALAYAGAGHSFHWEDPATFASDLLEFAGPLL